MSRMKSNIELMVATSGGKKVVVIPHSMGVLYFLHFMKWVETPPPMGGGGGTDWCARHIKAIMNIGGPFLGVPKAVSGLFSIEARDIAVARCFLRFTRLKCDCGSGSIFSCPSIGVVIACVILYEPCFSVCCLLQ